MFINPSYSEICGILSEYKWKSIKDIRREIADKRDVQPLAIMMKPISYYLEFMVKEDIVERREISPEKRRRIADFGMEYRLISDDREKTRIEPILAKVA